MIERSKNLTVSAGWCAAIALVTLAGCDRAEYMGPKPDLTAATAIRTALASSDGADSGQAATGPTGTGWATLRGRFTFEGTPPTMPPYGVDKDLATCAPGGRAPLQETLVVDSASNGIKYIAIYLRDASRVHESAQPDDSMVMFDQKVCVFLSHVLPVTVGQTMEIANSDPVGHNTNIAGRKNKVNQTIPAGSSIPFPVRSEEATPAPVSCSIHPWMKAYLLPRDNGYYAVTTADGSFEIPNLPAGEELEIQVWHERGTGSGGGLIVSSPEAKELDWSRKGRFTITLQEGEEHEINLAIPASAFGG